MENYLSIPGYIRFSIKKYNERPALAFVNQPSLSYKQLEDQIDERILFLHQLGVKKGDKVALLAHNSPLWGITYFAITFIGAVAVPLLPDFSSKEIENILNHSDVKIIFISDSLLIKINSEAMNNLEIVADIDNSNIISSRVDLSQYDGTNKFIDEPVNENDLAVIIYTSGTTGKSKGVMLTHKNICSNVLAGYKVQKIVPEDRFLSILPLSHTYENTLGFLLPLFFGASVTYLPKPPTPSVLLPALVKVRPTLMLSVPLIIEKIYRNKILPTFTKSPFMKSLYGTTPFRKVLNRIAGKKLMKTFGGELKFFGIGGAKLDREVEKFLIEAKFPYAIGYGLTETSPLLAGAAPNKTKLESTGPAVDGVELKLHDPDPVTGQGEIWAKGPNIMQGYYNEPEMTGEVFSDDGWFKTGDLGAFDSKGNLFIKGRIKNMIVGNNGENIYPEEIESLINNFNFVSESVVLQKKGKLVALVHFNVEELEKRYENVRDEISVFVEHKIEDLKSELLEYINSNVNKFSRIQMVIPQPVPFEKTATQKIKRYLYV